MPHIHALVLIKSSRSRKVIGKRLGVLLYPHAYYYEFPPFKLSCECTSSNYEGIEEANKTVGDFHRLWKTFQAIPKQKRPDWSQYVSNWEECAMGAAQANSEYKQPAADYDLCNRTGVMISTSPPSGLLYEGWGPDQWEEAGRASEISFDSRKYECIVTPDGQAHMLYGLLKFSQPATWAQETSTLLQKYKDHLAVRCFINR